MPRVRLARHTMRSCQYDGDALDEARSHPWTDAVGDSASRYYDLKTHPALIRTALEDFVPWAAYPAVTRLYRWLERINGPSSILESNDCAFTGPHPSEVAGMGQPLQCEGRVMVLYRQLEWNLSAGRCEDFTHAIHVCLSENDQKFEPGMVGTTLVPVHYRELQGRDAQKLGTQLMLSFWAWGGSDAELMANLDRVLRNLVQAVDGASDSSAA